MQWKLKYLDNPNKPNPYPADTSGLATKEWLGKKLSVWYTNAPEARAQFYIQNAKDVTVGDTISYKIVGSNAESRTDTPWVDPKIMIRVPKFVTVKDINTPKTLRDISADNRTKGQTAPVNVTLTHSDDTHNYYSFQVDGYTAHPYEKSITYQHFEIPFEFQIENGAKAGSYNIEYFTSQKDAVNFHMPILSNNTPNRLPS